MLTKRLIACLDMERGRVVKGVRFRDIRDAGDPVELAAEYYREGIDEVVFLDIGASSRSREILIDVVERVSSVLFIPLTVGGGLRSIDDMRRALRAGADKVSICSSALKDPSLITAGAAAFGSQCIVVSIDARRTGKGWVACSQGGTLESGRDAVSWAREAEERGAGEILLNSIDRDGTGEGYDLELLRAVGEAVSIPVIASGGGGNLEQMAQAFTLGGADSVLVASVLHFHTIRIPQIKDFLREQGVSIR